MSCAFRARRLAMRQLDRERVCSWRGKRPSAGRVIDLQAHAGGTQQPGRRWRSIRPTCVHDGLLRAAPAAGT